MKKIRNKINVIFTGKFLPYWYVAFALTLFMLLYPYYKASTVSKYEVTVFNESGKVVSKAVVDRDQLMAYNSSLPVTKSFKPLK